MDHAVIQRLIDRVTGPVLLAGQDGYDAERTSFNLAFPYRPDVIVGATDAQDVQAAVEFAAAHGLPVGVRATGHGASAATEGGLLITTRRMTEVRIDPQSRIASVGAGVRFDHLITEAAAHGLAPLNGSAPFVTVVPYTLGGGLSILARNCGYAADRVRGTEVVTADGQCRHVTPDSDPDLYWALLGGRDNFGIVTRLEMELVPVTHLYGGGLFFDAQQVPDLLEAYWRWTLTVPEQMDSSVALAPFPDLPQIPEPLRGRVIYHVRIAYLGSVDDGEQLIAPLRAAGPRLLDSVRLMPYTECGSIHNDPSMPAPWIGDSVMLTDLDQKAVATILAHATPDPAVPLIFEVRHLGGALARRPTAANAVGWRDARYLLSALTPLRGITARTAYPVLTGLLDAVKPWRMGRFLNFLAHTGPVTPNAADSSGALGVDVQELVRGAYQPEIYQRLTALKAVYDPENLFRLHYSIPPAAAPTVLSTT